MYYEPTQEQQKYIFPVDPFMGSYRITTATQASQGVNKRADDFPTGVVHRDHNRCVVLVDIGDYFCEAIHLIAHAKGNDVCISSYNAFR